MLTIGGNFGGGKGARRHALAEIAGGRAAGVLQFRQQRRIVGRVGDDGDVGVVLGGRADHAGAADVDVLDHLVAVRAASHGRLERVEVDDDEVDRANAVLVHRRRVRRIVAHGQKPAVNHRVQGLDPAVHHLGKAGQVGYVAHVEPGIAQRLRGAAGRDKFHPARGQRLAQVHEAGLVGHRKQRPADRYVLHVDVIPFS